MTTEVIGFGNRVAGTRGDRLLSTIILAIYAAYFVLGNFARPGKALPTGGIPVGELLLVGMAFGGVLRMRPPVPLELKVISGSFALSSVIGYLQHGLIGVLPAAYAVRLGAILFASVVIAHSIRTLWPARPTAVIDLTVVLLLVQAAIGWLLLVLVPDSTRLWAAMSRLGLGFPGDPHQNRLLGPLLDPNYFGNLLLLGAALTAGMIVRGSALWAVLAYGGFTASLVMTVSRSSVLGLIVWALVFVGLRVLHRERFRPLWRHWARLGAATAATMLLMSETVVRLTWRVVETIPQASSMPSSALSVEPSAAHRLAGLFEVVRLLMNPHVFAYGLGYNFLPLVSGSEYVVSAYDASPGNLLVTLGVPLSLLVVWACARWVRRSYLGAFTMDPTLADTILAYLVAAVAMSFFNNVLFYAPFLFLVSVILSVFHQAHDSVVKPGGIGHREPRQVVLR